MTKAIFLGVVAASLALFGNCEECKYSLEILALQDGSGSFASHVDRWASAAQDLLNQLDQVFGEYKIGLSSFTDKPIPKSGYGQYGGWGIYQQDYCYERHVPFTNSAAAMVHGLKELKSMIGAGFDIPEAQAEAMIYAAYDTSIGWSPTDVTHSESGRPIARIMLLITDARSHEAGNAATNLQIWNAQRQYPNGYEQDSTGGFGATDFLKKNLISTTDADSESSYYEMSRLFAKRDGAEAGVLSAMDEKDAARLSELIKIFGPEVFPDLKYTTHPGDNSTASDCTRTEYPSLEQMILALQKMEILPIFLTSTQEAYDFYEWYQTNVFDGMGIESVVAMFDSSSLFNTMVDSISKLVAKQCLRTSTNGPTTSSTTTTASTTTVPTTTTSSTTTTTTTTPVVVPPGGVTVSSKVESTLSEAGNETTESALYSTETFTTEEKAIPPPIVIPPEAGSGGSTGVIAGASAGAVAGLAAIGGVLYKTIGFSAFGNSAEAAGAGEQMETPESPVEREAMEEVTIDMFH